LPPHSKYGDDPASRLRAAHAAHEVMDEHEAELRLRAFERRGQPVVLRAAERAGPTAVGGLQRLVVWTLPALSALTTTALALAAARAAIATTASAANPFRRAPVRIEHDEDRITPLKGVVVGAHAVLHGRGTRVERAIAKRPRAVHRLRKPARPLLVRPRPDVVHAGA
jgi:hypothetical protein